MEAVTDEQVSDEQVPEWRLRWPGTVDRVELWQGNIAFEIRGFTGLKDQWTDADVEAARAVYPHQQVALSPGRVYIFVGPSAEDMVASMPARADEPGDEGA